VLDTEHVVAMIDWQMMSASAPTATVAFCDRCKDDSLRPTSRFALPFPGKSGRYPLATPVAIVERRFRLTMTKDAVHNKGRRTGQLLLTSNLLRPTEMPSYRESHSRDTCAPTNQ
jgi:hypothetical protein